MTRMRIFVRSFHQFLLDSSGTEVVCVLVFCRENNIININVILSRKTINNRRFTIPSRTHCGAISLFRIISVCPHIICRKNTRDKYSFKYVYEP